MKNIMTHLVYGYPSISKSHELFHLLLEHSRYVEVQIPFSDPIADGVIISEANLTALKQGILVDQIFDFLISQSDTTRVVIMCYFHIIYTYGMALFLQKMESCGVSYLIIPDIPIDEEEGKLLYELCIKYHIHFIVTTSPNASMERLELLNKYATGFIYAISGNMTTGSTIKFGSHFREYIERLRKYFRVPIGVGFGIHTRDDIHEVNMIADFSIVGTELLVRYNNGGIKAVHDYLENL